MVALIHAYKFSHREALAQPLADALWERHAENLVRFTRVVAVPLHRRRLVTRGFDQAHSLARHVARRLNRPLIGALCRVRPGPPQSTLPRSDRHKHLRRAFVATPAAARLHNERILLIDDVVTTGATLRAAAAGLRNTGARELAVLVIARTPGPLEAEDRHEKY